MADQRKEVNWYKEPGPRVRHQEGMNTHLIPAGALALAALLSACGQQATQPVAADTPSVGPASQASAPAETQPATTQPAASSAATPSGVTSSTSGTAASSSSAPSRATSGSSTAPGARKDAAMGFNTLHLGYVDVTTSAGPQTTRKAGRAGYYVKVCVRSMPPGMKTMPTSQSVWSLGTTPATQSFPRSSGYSPALAPRELAVGECNEGYVTFDTTKAPTQGVDAYVLTYAASFGDRGTWSFD